MLSKNVKINNLKTMGVLYRLVSNRERIRDVIYAVS